MEKKCGSKRLGWPKEELPKRRKGDKHKVEIAARLRSETTMSLKWNAQRLHVGSWTYVSNLPGSPQPKQIK